MLISSAVYPTIPVSDMERARSFYCDTLGFRASELGSFGGLVLEAGDGTRLLLYPSQFAGTNKATACGFEVDDVDTEVRALRERGVMFEDYDFPGLQTEGGIATMGDTKSAWFTDTEGNIIGVFSPVRAHA